MCCASQREMRGKSVEPISTGSLHARSITSSVRSKGTGNMSRKKSSENVRNPFAAIFSWVASSAAWISASGDTAVDEHETGYGPGPLTCRFEHDAAPHAVPYQNRGRKG